MAHNETRHPEDVYNDENPPPHASMTPEQERETKTIMKDLADAIQHCIPADFGFVLMIFEREAQKQLNYISNCERESVVTALKEFIEKTEKSWDKDREDGKFGIGEKQI